MSAGNFFAGVEVDYMVGTGSVTNSSGRSDELDYDSLLRAGVEVGYSIGRALLYGTGGYTRLELTNTGGSGDSYDSGGYFLGVGADYLITDRISIGREILQHKFSDFDGAFENVELDILTIGLNAAYRF